MEWAAGRDIYLAESPVNQELPVFGVWIDGGIAENALQYKDDKAARTDQRKMLIHGLACIKTAIPIGR